MERLVTDIYTFNKKVEGVENDYIISVQEKLKEYEDLEEQGLLLRLPCRVGDTVYKVWYVPCHNGEDCPDSYGCCGCEDECDLHKEISTFSVPDISWILLHLDDIGKSIWFLTLEEAEKELKNRMREEMQWLTWKYGKEWGEIQCPMLGDKYVMTYCSEDGPCYYSYTAPFVQDGEIYYYRFDHDEGCWDESEYCIGEYREGDWGGVV